tara:strand:- start:781 stop:1035 length:255 start_codon:yes stop_codon:yes gene_type:complete
MITNLIYLAVFLILIFVLTIAVKAITRGVEAKQNLRQEKNEEVEIENVTVSSSVINQIKDLKDLHNKGILSDEEFKMAKEKILK